MDLITSIIAPIGTVAGALTSTYTVANILIEQLGKRWKNKKAAEVMAFLHDLGLLTDKDARVAVDNWAAPPGFSKQHKEELIACRWGAGRRSPDRESDLTRGQQVRQTTRLGGLATPGAGDFGMRSWEREDRQKLANAPTEKS